MHKLFGLHRDTCLVSRLAFHFREINLLFALVLFITLLRKRYPCMVIF